MHEPDPVETEQVAAADQAFQAGFDAASADLKLLQELRRITAPDSHLAEPYHCPRVEHARNQMLIAAYERIARILRADLSDE